ncbi:MAG: hypothetical protein CBB94_12675 [Gammaproteobacteria bacterium TMED34]|nr:MAG: hypothetical protein CBB94_12675 [Gammaproteobacteria bacterium TMED34]
MSRRIILKFRGYISSRDLTDGSFVDQNIQNLIIRKSCEQNNFQYMLSATEYGMKNCFLMLNQVILELKKDKFDGVAFYSIDQLPNDINLRKKIYEVVTKNKKKILISQENILLSTRKDIEKFENLLKIKLLLNFCPNKIKN